MSGWFSATSTTSWFLTFSDDFLENDADSCFFSVGAEVFPVELGGNFVSLIHEFDPPFFETCDSTGRRELTSNQMLNFLKNAHHFFVSHDVNVNGVQNGCTRERRDVQVEIPLIPLLAGLDDNRGHTCIWIL